MDMINDVTIREKRMWVFRGEVREERIHKMASDLIDEGVALECIIDIVSEGPGSNDFFEEHNPISAILHVYPSSNWNRTESERYALAESATEYSVIERLGFVRDGQFEVSGFLRMGTQHRKAELSKAEFRDHWSGSHRALAEVHIPKGHRYVQDFVVSSSPGAPEVDGFFENAFATDEDYTKYLYSSPEGERLLNIDGDKFLDNTRRERFFARRTRVQRDVKDFPWSVYDS